MEAALIRASGLLKELTDTWRVLGEQESGAVLRACAMTIVTIARDNDDPQQLGSVIADVMHDYPCRAIILRFSPDPNAGLEARATVQCWMPHGRRQQICSELMDIQSPCSGAHQVLPVLRALLVPDLPVFYWCRDLPMAARPELQPLYRLAGRLIVDSVPMEEASTAYDAIRTLQRHEKPLCDLAWTRVTRWRQLLDNVFHTPSCRKRLLESSRALITWSGRGTPAVACYLGAWLKSHLPKLELELRCEAEEQPPEGSGRIRRLRLEGESFEMDIHRPGGTVVNVRSGDLQTSLMFPLLSEADALREELGILSRDARFETALQEAARLA